MDEGMTNADFERGEAAARTALLGKDVAAMKDDIKSLRDEVHEIKLTLARIEGGWKVAVFVAAVVGTVMGYVMKFLFDK